MLAPASFDTRLHLAWNSAPFAGLAEIVTSALPAKPQCRHRCGPLRLKSNTSDALAPDREPDISPEGALTARADLAVP